MYKRIAFPYIKRLILALLLSGTFLTVQDARAASCVVVADWSGAGCSICGGPAGNYSCAFGVFSPTWFGGCKAMANCVPAGNVVTMVQTTLFWSSGDNTTQVDNFNLTVEGVSVGTLSTTGNPWCGGCNTNSFTQSFTCSNGIVISGNINFCLNFTGANVCVDRAVITLTYQPLAPPMPGTISGPTSPCAGSVQTYSISAVAGATSYNWTVPGGWSINSGQGTTSISVTTSGTAGSVCVSSVNSCGSSSPRCLTVTPSNPPSTPGGITGSFTPCVGTSVTYSISAVSGATSYTWTVPAGWTITGGQGGTTLTVTVGSASGNICVRACNACGCSSFSCNAVNPTPVPAAPGSISGLTSPCAGNTVTYSISSVSGASSYQWTVPPGWTINFGQGSTSINVTAGAGSGSVCVRACNGCGCSAFTCVTVNPGSAPATPGTISGPSSVCPSANMTYSITPVSGATSYTWAVPGTWTINSGQGTTSINVTAGGAGGSITVQACNSCGCSSNQTLVVSMSSISITPTAVAESCNGGCDGSVSVSVSGGSAPFTYAWSNGCNTSSCSSLCAASYGVTVTDAGGCSSTGSATVLTGPPVLAGFSYNGNQCLAGNSFCFNNLGTSGATYAWDFGDGTGTSTAENPCYTYLASGSFFVQQTVTQGACSDVSFTTVVVYPSPVASIVGSNASCFGVCDGAANLTVTSGQSPFNYNWSSGQTTEDISPICAATYNVTVSDANSCTAIATVVITAPALLTATPSVTNITCNGACTGDATATAGGGTGPFTFNWDDPFLQSTATATGLCVGTYNATITDVNGCQATMTQAVTEPAAITLSFANIDASCGAADGTSCVTPVGGSSPYTYLWDNGQTTSCATALLGGGYNITVTDNNGCIVTGNTTVNTTGAVTASITASTNVTCNGGTDGAATVLESGGAPVYTYSWDDPSTQSTAIATNLPAGTWTATIVDGSGCIATASVTITEPTLLGASILSFNDPNCNGGCDGNATVTAAGGTSPYTYSWSPTGGNAALGTALCAGILYTVTVEDVVGCTTTDNITLSEPSILTSSIAGTDVSCFGGADGGANLTPGGGTAPYNFLWSNGATSEDLTNITAGTYCVTVTDNQGCTDIASCIVITEPADMVVSTTVVDAYCGLPNGSACASSVTGGTAPYTYLWDDPAAQTNSCATGLLGGQTFFVLVTDVNGCVSLGTAVINDLPAAVTVATIDNNASGFLICDGVATGAMSGGSAPYIYLWDDPLAQTTATATGLCAGSACITITDGAGCSSTDCIVITEPSAITLTFTKTDVDCNGNCNGTADVTVVGGVPPYTYLWTPGGMTTPSIVGLCAGTYVVDVTDNNSVITTDSVTITEPLAIVITMGGNDANCNGVCDGDASGAISGGTLPYTYLWDDPSVQTTATANGLCAGAYVLTVTDTNGCSNTNSFTVNEPVAMILSTSTVDATCGQADGSATVTVVNGVLALTYLWDGGQTSSTATGLAAGAHQVVVTDATGCIDSITASVVNALGPIATITDSTDATCFGVCDGDATVAASGGTAPYTYSWSPSGQTTVVAAFLCAGTHIALVTDATGCSSSASVVIDEPGNLVASATVLSDPNCNGSCDGVATVSVVGGTTPYSFQWDDPALQTGANATALCANTFSVVVTDANNCVATGTVTLVEPLALSLTITTVDPGCSGGCNGSAIVVPTGGVTPYTYTWSNGDNTAQADSLCANTYVITVTDANGCAAISTATISNPPALVASVLAIQDVACNGGCDGFITVTQSGGTPPYSYNWNNGNITATASFLCLGPYNVTISDANGCTDTISATISQPTTLTLSISKTNVQCNGACDGTATVNVGGGVPPFTYQWDDPLFQTTSTASNLCDGLLNVTVTDTSGCSTSAIVFINQPQSLSIVIDTVTSSTCGAPNGGACVNPVGGQFPYTFEWNDPFSTIGTCVNNVFAGTYRVIVLDGNGCFDSLLVPINDIGAPTIDSVTTIGDNCYNDSIGEATIFISGATDTINNNYYWTDFNGDTIDSGMDLFSIFGLGGGTSYGVTVEDGTTLCLTSEVFVINLPTPLNTAIFPTSVVDISCNGLCDGSATVNVSGGTGAYTYSWLPTSTDITATADSLCGGAHLVFVTDAGGCMDSSVTTITEPLALNVVPTVTDVSCFGAADGIVDLVPSPTGGTPPYGYIWFPSGIAGNVQTATNLGAGTDTVVTTDLRGCTDTTIVTIIEPSELLIDTFTTVSDFCGSAQGGATITPIGGTPIYTYAWNTIPPQADSNATGLLAGVYNVVLSDSKGCNKNATITVPGTPGPIVDAVVTDAGCFGDSTGLATALVSSGTPPFAYSWNDSQAQTTQTATGLPAGLYICTVTDFNGCLGIKVVTISEPSDIVTLMFANPTALICFGDSTLISTVALGGNPPYIYNWNLGLPDTTAHLVSPPANTTITYVVIVTDSSGCTAEDSISIVVNPALVLTTSPFVQICPGETTTLTATPSAGNAGPYTVTWDDGVSTTTHNVVAGDSSQISVTPTFVTNYTVVVSDGCSLNDTVLVTLLIAAPPIVGFYADQTSGCTITFTDTSAGISPANPQPDPGLIRLWEWDFGDGTTIGPDSGIIFGQLTTSGTYINPTHFYADSGTYTVTVTVTDENGCTSSLTLVNYITSIPPVAYFSYDPSTTIIKDSPILFTDLTTGSVIAWAWDFGDSIGTSTTQNPTYTYTDTGVYQVMLIVVAADGCIDTVVRSLTVTENLVIYVPNIFAPEDPTKNSMLYVSGIGVSTLKFIIYDRWGEKIFETTSATRRDRDDGNGNWYGEGWDGTKNGKSLSSQVFVYYLEADLEDGESVIMKGNITLIK